MPRKKNFLHYFGTKININYDTLLKLYLFLLIALMINYLFLRFIFNFNLLYIFLFFLVKFWKFHCLINIWGLRKIELSFIMISNNLFLLLFYAKIGIFSYLINKLVFFKSPTVLFAESIYSKTYIKYFFKITLAFRNW